MDRTLIQRVRSHGASLNCRAFDIADRFLDGLFAHCPHLRTPGNRFRGTPAAQRRCVAHQWAWFVRHLGELNQVTPELESLYTFLQARGLSGADFKLARGAFLEALRDISGGSWNASIESDWACAFDECLRLMSPAASIPMPSEERYAVAA